MTVAVNTGIDLMGASVAAGAEACAGDRLLGGWQLPAQAVSSSDNHTREAREERQVALIMDMGGASIITWNEPESEMYKYIVIRYTCIVPAKITTEDYRSLSELRYRIRHFLRDGDAVVRAAGLEPQQYLMLLTIRGLPDGHTATIRTLAERLALKHHSAVELVDRLEAHGYVHRNRAPSDRRAVLVTLLPRGERVLENVARQRIKELHSHGHELVRAIKKLLEKNDTTGSGRRSRKASGRKSKH